MAMTNHERVGKALDLLKNGLGPFIGRELTSVYKDRALAEARRLLPADDRLNSSRPANEVWKAQIASAATSTTAKSGPLAYQVEKFPVAGRFPNRSATKMPAASAISPKRTTTMAAMP